MKYQYVIFFCRIHTLGSANRSKTHPDGRAILFEDMTYRYQSMFIYILHKSVYTEIRLEKT